MSLRFAKQYTPFSEKSPAQKRQWHLFAALGYTIGIRGYLNCWQRLLKTAGITSPRTHGAIETALAASAYIEKEIRWQIKHIPSSARTDNKQS